MLRPRFLAAWILLVAPGVLHAATEPAAELSPEAPPAQSLPTKPLPTEITPADWLVLPRVGDYRRAPLHIDPVEAAVARGEWVPPTIGDPVGRATGGEAVWRADDTPRSADLAGGYAYAEFDSPAEGVMLLEAPSCAAVCLNGEWLPGDPYRYGWFRPPAPIAEGKNWLLVHLARPGAKPRLVRPASPVALLTGAVTAPDLVMGDGATLWASVPLVNASDKPLVGAELRVRWGDGEAKITPLRSIDSRLITPITFKLPPLPEGFKPGERCALNLEVTRQAGDAEPITLAAAELPRRVARPGDRRVETFVSEIDGSVQSYAWRPAPAGGDGLLVALHDAGQTAQECLDDYASRPEGHVLAPGGRGRWAFDWEAWSRLDALEALAAFQARRRAERTAIDPDRIALTGRGMGGHGALSVATLSPELFSAVGVANGWISLYTQGGAVVTPRGAGPIAQLLGRQASANDPLRSLVNLAGMGVSVLHTGSGRTPIEESRYLRERLGEFHNDFSYREPIADETADGLLTEQWDWLASRQRRVSSADRIEFSTPNVGSLSEAGWATILAADVQGAVAGVRLSRDPARREVTGTTSNVRRLRLSFADWPRDAEKPAARVRLDGGPWIEFSPGRDGDALALARDDEGVWRRAPDTNRGAMSRFAGLFKDPLRTGGFDSAFCCRPLLAYGTRGSAEEQRWAAAKARYDAHVFLYRGAGRLEVVADTTLDAAQRSQKPNATQQELRDPQRSLVLYGNRSTNAAWTAVRREAFQRRQRTVRIEADAAWVGQRPESGDDLAVLAVRPRAGSRRACVGVVGGTGEVGMRMTTRLRYFWSGVAYPDVLIFGPDCLAPGEGTSPTQGVRATGYFDTDWGLDTGDILWRDPAI